MSFAVKMRTAIERTIIKNSPTCEKMWCYNEYSMAQLSDQLTNDDGTAQRMMIT